MKNTSKIEKDFDFFCKRIGQIITVEDIVEFTGRTISTVKVYISKKWYFFLEKQSTGYLITQKIKEIKFETFSSLYEQKTTKSVEENENSVFTNKYFHAIENITITKYYSIKNVVIENLSDKKEIYFLGENGMGKTILLQSIVLASVNEYEMPDYMAKYFGDEMFPYDTFEGNTTPHKCEIFGYGISRFHPSEFSPDKYGFSTLFNRNVSLTHPIKWLERVQRLELKPKKDKDTANYLKIGLETVILFLEKIINIGGDKEFKVHETASSFNFIERNTELEFEQLADGYRSVLIWLCDLLSRLVESQPDVTNIADFKGVVLVDEIDMLLHPKWELVIVQQLRKLLPNIQWFFTTHSPNLILGASKDAVFYKVYKKDGDTEISEPWQCRNIHNLLANSILTSPLFDLDTARMRAFDEKQDSIDTNENYWYSRIEKVFKEERNQQKNKGKGYFSEQEIDEIVKKAIAQVKEGGLQ